MQDNRNSKYLNTFLGNLTVGELVRNGVTQFCISPGSRSTPLVAAAAANIKAVKTIIYDERSSAFFALGYAQAKNMPAAVITTSGTAVSNLFPAIVEAGMNKVPMILLTADRPFELQDVGANQTIDQDNIFSKYVKWFCNIPSPDNNLNPEVILSAIDHAVYLSRKSPAGPVHLNFMFREPLEPLDFPEPDRFLSASGPHTSYGIPVMLPDMESAGRIREIINNTSRGLLSVGRLASDEDREAVSGLAEKLQWPVYADITSGLRLNGFGTNIIKHFDQELIGHSVNEAAAPGTVIHFGNPITSKRFAQFLGQNRPRNFIVIKPDSSRYDPIHAVTEFIEADISPFCNALSLVIACNSIRYGQEMKDFNSFYEKSAGLAQQSIETYFRNEYESANNPQQQGHSISEISVARIVSRLIAQGSSLFLSSSMPIRDMELYAADDVSKKILIGTNRGASGIDGIISSAAGFSAGSGRMCTLIAGDLAFIHDLNALSFLRNAPLPLIIIIINNHGGGIFDFLPISSNKSIFEKYFVTPHDFNFKGIAKDFRIDYFNPATCQEFESVYRDASLKAGNIKGVRSTVIEIVTDRRYNFDLRRKIKKDIIDKLNSGGILNE